MFTGGGKNALAKNVQTTRSKFVSGVEETVSDERDVKADGESLRRERDLPSGLYSLPPKREKQVGDGGARKRREKGRKIASAGEGGKEHGGASSARVSGLI